jgi:hypothetical protein
LHRFDIDAILLKKNEKNSRAIVKIHKYGNNI